MKLTTNKKIFKMIIFFILILFLIFLSYFFIGEAPRAEKINLGVNFSQKHAKDLGLDWKETFSASSICQSKSSK